MPFQVDLYQSTLTAVFLFKLYQSSPSRVEFSKTDKMNTNTVSNCVDREIKVFSTLAAVRLLASGKFLVGFVLSENVTIVGEFEKHVLLYLFTFE